MTDDLLDEATRLHYEVIRDDREAEWRRLTAEHDLVPALIERVQQAEAQRDQYRADCCRAEVAEDEARGKLDKVRQWSDNNLGGAQNAALLAILDGKTGD